MDQSAAMRALIFLLLLVVPAGAAWADRATLGIFFGWGAFKDSTPRRCFAIAEAQRRTRPGEERAFASVGFWKDRNVRGQLYFRLSRPKREGSAVLLRIDDRTFQLIGAGQGAWAPHRRSDAQIVGALRTGIEMSVETRAQNGATVRDRYGLRGAATAIDAAAIGCARG